MIQTETTPNPNSLKFLSEKTISEIGTEEFQKGETKKLVNPFIKELLDFDGVELVLLSENFLSLFFESVFAVVSFSLIIVFKYFLTLY